MECSCCKKNKELRFGVCFDCADAETIIDEGLDMYDKGLDESDEPAKSPLSKVKLLIQKGWEYTGRKG
jgi:hypothetical protein